MSNVDLTGPPYPRYAPGAAPGQNSIGRFVIGQSPLGTLPWFDWWQTIIGQYANSPIIDQLTSNFFQYIDQTQNFDSFYDLMWNVDTAQGYGLDVLGRKVGVQRTLQLPGGVTYLGFNEADSWTGFGQGGLYSGQAITSNLVLDDADFRTLVFAKALGNISDGSSPSINQLLLNLFPGRGRCYVADGLNMTLTYTFEFVLTTVEATIIAQSGVLPSAAGVAVSVQQQS